MTLGAAFRSAWSTFAKDWFTWVVITALVGMCFAGLALLTRLPYFLGGLRLAELPWYFRYLDSTIIGTLGSAAFYWLCATGVATIDEAQADREPLREVVFLLPQLLCAKALLSVLVVLVVQSARFDSVAAWILSWSIGFLFMLFEPLIALRRMAPLRAVFVAPILLFRSPRHALGFFFAHMLGVAGLLAFGFGALATVPVSLLAVLYLLQDMDRAAEAAGGRGTLQGSPGL